MKKTKWTPEIIDFMIKNYQGKDNIELANLLNDKFNLNTNGDRVSNIKSKLKRTKGINLCTGINSGCIKKGNTPFNKGKKWNEYLSLEQQQKSLQTTFKKGNIPQNYRKVGSKRVTVDGYWEIKTSDPNKWELLHRYKYEKKYGKIPNGYKLIFADGNKNNLKLSNLILVSNKEELHMNKRKLRFDNKELTKTGLNIVKVILKTSELEVKK